MTHNGTFHCDEALACYMLLNHVDDYKNSDLIRTRDTESINKGDVVVDVGGVYDHALCKYDHHQRTFDDKFSDDFDTRLSSAGLVYKHYGKQIIQSILASNSIPQLTQEELQTVYKKVYKVFIEGLDAIDNGVQQYDSKSPAKYINRTDLSARVSNLNPQWYERNEKVNADDRFKSAMLLTGSELSQSVLYVVRNWLPVKNIIRKLFEKRFEHHPSGSIIVLDEFVPWKDHMFQTETELKVSESERPLYVLYEDDTNHSWRVQCVPESPGSFVSRAPLPEEWRGVRDEDLDKVSGIEGCVFVHASGFIGGNKTFEGALEMTKKSLRMFMDKQLVQ